MLHPAILTRISDKYARQRLRGSERSSSTFTLGTGESKPRAVRVCSSASMATFVVGIDSTSVLSIYIIRSYELQQAQVAHGVVVSASVMKGVKVSFVA
jgi:hypothetical protein